MRKFTSADAKNHFGELIDAARAEPVAITKYDRTVIVVMAIEEYKRLCGLLDQAGKPREPTKAKHSRFMIQKTGKRVIRARQTMAHQSRIQKDRKTQK